jgi:hypothetical protein
MFILPHAYPNTEYNTEQRCKASINSGPAVSLKLNLLYFISKTVTSHNGSLTFQETFTVVVRTSRAIFTLLDCLVLLWSIYFLRSLFPKALRPSYIRNQWVVSPPVRYSDHVGREAEVSWKQCCPWSFHFSLISWFLSFSFLSCPIFTSNLTLWWGLFAALKSSKEK